jgi:hypothetical protein
MCEFSPAIRSLKGSITFYAQHRQDKRTTNASFDQGRWLLVGWLGSLPFRLSSPELNYDVQG